MSRSGSRAVFRIFVLRTEQFLLETRGALNTALFGVTMSCRFERVYPL
jgi:hypothetical protein